MLPRSAGRLAVATLVLGLLGLGGARVDAAPQDGTPAPAEVPVHVVSYNVDAATEYTVWEEAVDHALTLGEVMGLQEVNTKPKSAHLEGLEGWGTYRPAELRQNPVVWDESVFSLTEARGELLAEGRYVGDEKPGSPTYRKDTYATVVRLLHLPTQQTVSVINVHLTAGGVNNGQPIEGRPILYEIYCDEVRSLAAIVDEERAWAPTGTLLTIGDFNNNYRADRKWHKRKLAYYKLTRRGQIASWEAVDPLLPGEGSGTRAGSYLDQIWSGEAADEMSIDKTYGAEVSDHYPIVATYSLEVLPEATTP